MRVALYCLIVLAMLGWEGASADTTNPKSPSVQANKPTFTATFSHKPGSPRVATLSPKAGDSIQVVLADTCKDDFQLAVEDLVAVDNSPAAAAAAAAGSPCTGADQLTATTAYDPKYTAYLVKVTPKAGIATPVTTTTGINLDATDFVIYVGAPSPWSTDFSGGFTHSKLTNPKYSLQPVTGSAGTYTVVRDSASEDSASLGFAGFVTVSRSNWTLPSWLGSPNYGVTFGLGVNTGSRVQFYPGLSLRFGDLFVTVGANLGSVDALPAGLHEGSTTMQANALGSLPTRTSGGAFLALSYKFLGTSVEQTLQGKISQPSK